MQVVAVALMASREKKLRSKNPVLYRKAGEVEIERTASYEGVEYDPRLFDEGEIGDFWELARRAFDPDRDKRFERLVRLAESQRAAKEWPVIRRIGQWLSNHRFQEALDALISVGLGPGTADYEEVKMRITDAKIAHEQSEMRKTREAMARRDERRARERIKDQKLQALARQIRKAREVQAERVSEEHAVLFDRVTRRWVARSDPEGASFASKEYARKWSLHIEGKENGERDRLLLARLLTADRRAAVRRAPGRPCDPSGPPKWRGKLG